MYDDCNRNRQVRPPFLLVFLLLTACAGQPVESEAEARILQLDRQVRKESRFPVLVPLPQAGEVVGAGIPPRTAGELRGAASALSELRGEAGAPQPSSLTTDETVAELRAMVEDLRAVSARPSVAADVDIGALGFPTPPPLED